MPSKRSDLIADIYDAALGVDALGRASATICAAVAGETVVSYTTADGAVDDVVAHGVEFEALTPYETYFHAVDPVLAAIMQRKTWGKGRFGYELVPDRMLAESEFYRDFARHLGIFHMLACGLTVCPGRTFVVGAHRPADAACFGSADKACFNALLPHLQRMLQLKGRLAEISEARVGFAALDALAMGAVICDGAGRILFANAAAEAAARDEAGLVLGPAGHGLGALQQAEGKQLALLVADAAQGGSGGGLALTGRDGAVLLVLVAPLPRRLADGPGRVLVTMRSATAQPTVEAGTLVRLFGLTPAEAKLALALLAGRSLADIGADRRVSENTLRTQLARILDKTNTGSQRDLVRVLGLVPPLR